MVLCKTMSQSGITEKELSEKELRNVIKVLTTEMPKFFSNLLGKDLRKGKVLDKKLEDELYEKSRNFLEGLKEIDILESAQISQTEKISRTYCLIDKLLRIAIPEIPQEIHAVEDGIEFLRPKIPSGLEYLKNTRYLEYISLIEKLSLELKAKGKTYLVRDFLDDVSESDDAYIIAHTLCDPLVGHYKYLQKEHRYIRKQQIKKYIEIYSELSGCYEKQLRVIVGLLKILEKDEKPDYENIRKKDLYKNIQKVEKEKHYKILTEGFNRKVRNAISHRTYKIDILDKRIDFIDRNNKVLLSYFEFINLVKETSALVFAVLQLQNIFTYHLFVMFRDLVMNQKEKDEETKSTADRKVKIQPEIFD
ncbi:MAG: hypothetical protein PHD13_02630 [Methanocellales archaeon]|nr:hypothetical protein [Methanocellales archaeon]MDD3291706.1 hypothetical protein [Methanocellales archaeon]MDD5235056.1 hypothetical protein [Methanocellales archaeon]MDD5485194.1 hypothetical protein [Methanocellales archaeon]